MRSRESSVAPMSNCSSDSGGWRLCGLGRSHAGRRKTGRNLTLSRAAAITETAPRQSIAPTFQRTMTDSGGGGLRNTIYRRLTRSNRRMTAGRRLAYAHRGARWASGSSCSGGCAAWCASRARSISRRRSRRRRRSSRATGTSISSSAAGISSISTSARAVEVGLAHQPVGGRRDGRDDGAAPGRARDPRLVDQHRRARAARLLPGAGEGERLAGHHAGRAARPAVQIQAGRDPARADVGAADPADGLCRIARVARSSGTSSCCPVPFSRIVIAVGPPRYVPRVTDAAAIEKLQGEMEAELKRLLRRGARLRCEGRRA